MTKILGLDLGTNSIGWTLIDDVNNEIKSGVRIFPEGVNDINTSKEKSKNSDRRTARGIRRSNYRFKMRRKRLEKVLKELGMSPDEKYYTFKKNHSGEKIYLTKELYKLRKDALEIPLRLEDMGRIFLHLNNHRGFKSNKKEEADKQFTNKVKDADKINTIEQKQATLFELNRRNEKLLNEIKFLKDSQRKDALKRIKVRNNRIKKNEKKIKEVEETKTLQEIIDAAKSEGSIKYGTLGEYYYHLIELNKDSHNPNEAIIGKGTIRIRNNDDGEGGYTTREIYEFEFDLIWERQKELNSDNSKVLAVLIDENKRRIKDECIFYQRDLRSQKHLVDRCNYEYTEYYIYKFNESNLQEQINSINYSYSGLAVTFLDKEQKEKLFTRLKKKNEITISEIKSLIGLKDKFQNVNDKLQNTLVINNLPIERFNQKDYSTCTHVSSLEFQEFRIWDKVNNLRYIDSDDVEQFLTFDQKQILVQKLHATDLLTIETGNKASDDEKEEAFEIKQALGLSTSHQFKEQKIKGNVTLSKLKDALGEDYWNSLNPSVIESEIEAIDKTTGEILTLKGHIQYSDKQKQLYNQIVFAMNFIKSVDWLKGKGKAKKWSETITQLGLDKNQLELYSKIFLEPDYCNYSLKAIKKLLPWMKMKPGLNSSQAAEKAGYESASDERKNDAYLQDKLPELQNNTLRNPIVQRGLTETIKLINEIIEKELNGQKPDKVHLEMARELKKPKAARQEAKKKNDDKEKERNQWKEFLKVRLGIEPSGNTLRKFEFFLELEYHKQSFDVIKNRISVNEFIEFCKNIMGETVILSSEKFAELKMKLSKKGENEESPEPEIQEINEEIESKDKNKVEKNNLKLLRYRLYLECDRILPYTGQPISLTRLLEVNSDIEIEHIIPYSRCMDDSFLNKTLSDKGFNTKKGKQTPIEYFASDPSAKKHFISRVNKIKNEEKRKRFLIEGADELEKFRNSQLVNTAYIATEVKSHLLNTFKRDDIVMTNGQITAMLRGFLGFNKILNPPIRLRMEYPNGKYWAIINENNVIEELIAIPKENTGNKPKSEKNTWKIVEGSVYEGLDGKRFQPKKQRNDHRHHAIDAIAIALSSNSITNIIQKNTEGYYEKDGKQIQQFEDGALWIKKFNENGELTTAVRKKIIEEIKSELPFPRIWQEAKSAVENIPISYNNKNRIFSKAGKNVHKNKSIFKSGGDIARGQLHEAFIYGKTKNLSSDEFVRRINVKNLTWPQIRTITDQKIKTILISDVAKNAEKKFQIDSSEDSTIQSFALSFDELVKLDIEETFFKDEVKFIKEMDFITDEEKRLLKEYKIKLKFIKERLKIDNEKNNNKKGKKYKDYLRNGFKEAMKKGFFLENKGRIQNNLNENIIRNPIPIKKIRVKYISTAMKDYKPGVYNQKAFVKPGENYCIVLYGNESLEEGENRVFKPVPFMDAVKKKKIGEPLYPEEYQGKKFLAFLSKKDMVLVFKEHPDEITHLIGKKQEDYSQDEKELLFKRLFVVRKSDKNGLIVLSRHNLSGAKEEDAIPVKDFDSNEGKVIRCNPNTFRGKKILIDRLGNILPA